MSSSFPPPAWVRVRAQKSKTKAPFGTEADRLFGRIPFSGGYPCRADTLVWRIPFCWGDTLQESMKALMRFIGGDSSPDAAAPCLPPSAGSDQATRRTRPRHSVGQRNDHVFLTTHSSETFNSFCLMLGCSCNILFTCLLKYGSQGVNFGPGPNANA